MAKNPIRFHCVLTTISGINKSFHPAIPVFLVQILALYSIPQRDLLQGVQWKYMTLVSVRTTPYRGYVLGRGLLSSQLSRAMTAPLATTTSAPPAMSNAPIDRTADGCRKRSAMYCPGVLRSEATDTMSGFGSSASPTMIAMQPADVIDAPSARVCNWYVSGHSNFSYLDESTTIQR